MLAGHRQLHVLSGRDRARGDNLILAYDSGYTGEEESSKNPTGQYLEPLIPSQQPCKGQPNREWQYRQTPHGILRPRVSLPAIDLAELHEGESAFNRVDERLKALIGRGKLSGIFKRDIRVFVSWRDASGAIASTVEREAQQDKYRKPKECPSRVVSITDRPS